MLQASFWGALLTLIQLAFALAFTQPTSAPPADLSGLANLKNHYVQLVNWDSQRYRDIAENGYRIPGPVITSADIHEGRANVVFFPGYPLASRLVQKVLSLSTDPALLVTAQFFCWLFWVYFIMFLQLRGAPPKTIAASCLLVAAHPAAFFLVAGYTEALFLAGLIGLIYFTEKSLKDKSPLSWLTASTHALVMSLTRIVSFAMAPYAFLRTGRLQARTILPGVFSTLGAVFFFSYCQWKFGEWNLYFRLEEIGWHNYRRWFAILDPLSYVPRFFVEHTVDSFNRASVTFTAFLFILAWRLERPKKLLSIPRERLALYFSALILFYIPLTGKAAANMDSMSRYTLPVFVLQILALAQLQSERDSAGAPSLLAGRSRYAVWAGSLLALIVQGWFTYRFLRGKWVA
jgi:hypothetical protein